jgi:hypothetical protein
VVVADLLEIDRPVVDARPLSYTVDRGRQQLDHDPGAGFEVCISFARKVTALNS